MMHDGQSAFAHFVLHKQQPASHLLHVDAARGHCQVWCMHFSMTLCWVLPKGTGS